MARATFSNFFRRAIEVAVGAVFSVDPVLGEDVPDAIKVRWENIDNAGTHGDLFLRSICQDAMIAGHSAALVEMPRENKATTRADEIREVLDPYWVPIRAENIVSHRWIIERGKVVLTQAVLRECHMIPKGEYGEEEVESFRVFRRTRRVFEDKSEKIVVSFKVLTTIEGTQTETDSGEYVGIDVIPLVEFPTSGKLGLFESDPPYSDVAFENLKHYRQSADHDLALSMSSCPMLVRIGAVKGEGDAGELAIGPNSALDLPLNADAKYVTPSADALDAAARDRENTVSTIGSMSAQLLAPQKRAAETAEAKRLDKMGGDSVNAVNARGWQDAAERCMELHAKYLGLPSGGSIEINRDFGSSVMEPEVISALAAMVKAGMPARIALDMMLAGGRIPEDADLDMLEAEWAGHAAAEKDTNRDNLMLNLEDAA